MRLSRTLSATVAAAALTALTACGSNDDTGGQGLPKAKDVAAMERFVSQYTVCKELRAENPSEQGNRSDFEDLPKGTGAGVKERAYCEADRGQPIALVAVSDMKKFVQALKANEQAGKDSTGALVGADFAVIPTDDTTTRALKAAGLLVASCDPTFNARIPSGYTKREGLVDGCVMTDFIPA
ncbi:hypothetical protein [Streptomyces sp. NPDC056056]|uniref:hypothetical protein n=1 Tax=Streptomyces sp. NPDC056056 TaxID=3345698 RepID=UPI0035E19410